MERVFLDANIILAPLFKPTSRLLELWALPKVELVTSRYAVAEVVRNAVKKSSRGFSQIDHLLAPVGLVDESSTDVIPATVELREKDRPILAAAIACQANYLLTGDTDFRSCFGRTIGGVLVLRPADYLALKRI